MKRLIWIAIGGTLGFLINPLGLLIGGFIGYKVGGASSSSLDDGFKTGEININPATGLPIIGDSLGIDVAGNPYGTDLDYSSSNIDDSFDLFDTSFDDGFDTGNIDINPATGLPVIGDSFGIDVAGNPYGTDLDYSNSSIDDSFGTSFDDSL